MCVYVFWPLFLDMLSLKSLVMQLTHVSVTVDFYTFTYLKLRRFPKIGKHVVCSLASYSKMEIFIRQSYFYTSFIRLKRYMTSVLIKCSMTVLPSESH